MSRPDDPEQRIRDLERPASRTAPYEAPPSDAAPPSAGRLGGPDRRGVSSLLFALGLLIIVLGGAAFLLFGREPTAGTPVAAIDRPPPSRAPSSIPAVPTPKPQPTLPVIPTPPEVDPTGPTVVADGGSVSVSGIDEHRTLTCTGGAVEISGINNTVEITGHCGRVTVSGIENVVTLESADVIEASGIGSSVTYHAGTPRIDSSGSDVTVQQG